MEDFINQQLYTVKLIDITLSFFAFIITFLGVWAALVTYTTTASANITNANNAHFQNFKIFVEKEIENNCLNCLKKVNIFVLYNELFGRTGRSQGLVGVSDEYKQWVIKLVAIVDSANNNYINRHVNDLNYTYQKHQTIIIEHFEKIQIHLDRSTKTGFYQLESEVFNFINTLNLDFCFLTDEQFAMAKREYPKNSQ